jgi:hypothetical protein
MLQAPAKEFLSARAIIVALALAVAFCSLMSGLL